MLYTLLQLFNIIFELVYNVILDTNVHTFKAANQLVLLQGEDTVSVNVQQFIIDLQ